MSCVKNFYTYIRHSQKSGKGSLNVDISYIKIRLNVLSFYDHKCWDQTLPLLPIWFWNFNCQISKQGVGKIPLLVEKEIKYVDSNQLDMEWVY